MKKVFKVVVLVFLFLAIDTAFAQEKRANDADIQLKETLYKKYKREAHAFSKNDFDALFFEFFRKQKDENLVMTKEGFYTYTTKIAAYSEKLGLLYKDQKEESQRTKQEWFDKSYSDYLQSKKH